MVHLSKRSESKFRYVVLALDIEKVTWEICDLIPKTHTFKMTNELFAISRRIVQYTQYANYVLVKNKADCDAKIDCLKKAYRDCGYFFTQMGILLEKVGIKESLITKWCELVDTEMDKLSEEVRSVERHKATLKE